MLGISRPGDMGFDIIHLNLHKTFSTPHGGGGPGAGPVGVKAHLKQFLPVPEVVNENGRFHLKYDNPLSIGQIGGFYGNFGILVRAYTYILSMGKIGLREISQMAVLNANYVKNNIIPEEIKVIEGIAFHIKRYFEDNKIIKDIDWIAREKATKKIRRSKFTTKLSCEWLPTNAR
jgi:glycine dehydrogenase subunit 2